MHFWVNHRLLHTRPLRRFHLPHHRSVVTTPFSTYSFHPIEALMLGNVIMLPMMLHDFSFWSLASVPLFSLFFNRIGHANYDFFPRCPMRTGSPPAAGTICIMPATTATMVSSSPSWTGCSAPG